MKQGITYRECKKLMWNIEAKKSRMKHVYTHTNMTTFALQALYEKSRRKRSDRFMFSLGPIMAQV